MELDRRVGFFNRETILRLSLSGWLLKKLGEKNRYQVDHYLVEEKGNRRLTEIMTTPRRMKILPTSPSLPRRLSIQVVRRQRIRISARIQIRL